MDKFWYPGAQGNRIPPPVYSTVPIIKVADTVAVSRPKRLAFWRKARTEALLMWTPSGLKFEVHETGPLLGGLTPDAVTLHLSNLPRGINGHASFASPPVLGTPHGAGWLAINRARFGVLYLLYLTKLNRNYALKKLRLYIAHEFGHTLGFDHGGNGIMAGAWHPSAEEILVLSDYYNTGV